MTTTSNTSALRSRVGLDDAQRVDAKKLQDTQSQQALKPQEEQRLLEEVARQVVDAAIQRAARTMALGQEQPTPPDDGVLAPPPERERPAPPSAEFPLRRRRELDACPP